MKRSAGILPYKIVGNDIYVYLEHPGGPYWKNVNKWSFCKGEYKKEKAIDAAIREFYEESGTKVEKSELEYLTSHKVSSIKLVVLFCVEKDIDCSKMKSNTFKKVINGEELEFFEMDKAEWFKIEDAYDIIFDNQVFFLRRLEEKLRS